MFRKIFQDSKEKRARMVADECYLERPYNHGLEVEDEDVQQVFGNDNRNRYRKFVETLESMGSSRQQAIASVTALHVMQPYYRHWKEMYGDILQGNLKAYCKLRTIEHYSDDVVAYTTKEQLLQRVDYLSTYYDTEMYDAEYLKYTYAGLYDLLTSNTLPTCDLDEASRMLEAIASRVRDIDEEFKKDLKEQVPYLQMFLACCEAGKPMPKVVVDVMLRTLDEAAVDYHVRVCNGQEPKEDDVEVPNLFDIPVETTEIVPVDQCQDEDQGKVAILVTGKTVKEVEDKQEEIKPRFMVTLDEEHAKQVFETYVKLRAVADYPASSGSPPSIFVSFVPNKGRRLGLKIGVGRSKIKLPKKLGEFYNKLGITLGMSFWMDPRMRQSAVKQFMLHGIIDPKYAGFAPKVRSPLDYMGTMGADLLSGAVPSAQPSVAKSNMMKTLAMNRGNFNAYLMMGLNEKAKVTYDERDKLYGKHSDKKPTRVLSKILRGAKQQDTFVGEDSLMHAIMSVYCIDYDEARQIACVGMCIISGALEFNTSLSGCRYSTM